MNKSISENVTVSGSKKHRILSIMALCGLFVCGMMFAFAISGAKSKNTEQPCEAVEKILQARLQSYVTESNLFVYELLIQNGCPENVEKYTALANTEKQILLSENHEIKINGEVVAACETVENLLKKDLNPDDDRDYDSHLANARTYSMLAERGCSENSEKYKQMALRDIEISNALSDGYIEKNDADAEQVIETYKRLQMEHEAQVVLDKLKKMTKPTIDFILHLEKIINEE